MNNNKKSAKEAAQFVLDHPNAVKTHDILAMIPDYKMALPVNSWIAQFKKSLPEVVRIQFNDLTWQKQKEYMRETE